jgi:hypothetical protein
MATITSYVRPNVVKPKIYAIRNVFIKKPKFFFGQISSAIKFVQYWLLIL